MRHCPKSAEPDLLSDFKKQNPTATYDSFKKKGQNARDLREILVREQNYCCCYCGRRIKVEDDDCHNEHFDRNEEVTLEYENIFASCGNNPPAGYPNTCGISKGSQKIDASLIPSNPTVEQRFRFLLSGFLMAEDEQAEDATKKLNLNSSYLKAERKRILTIIQLDMDRSDINRNNIAATIRDARAPDLTGESISFGHVIANYLEKQRRHPRFL